MPKNPEAIEASEPSVQPGPSPEAPPANGFFAWLRSIDIPRQPGWIGGVCAGIAARLGIDPLIVRGIVVVIAILGGPAVLLYALAWLLLPDHRDSIHLENLVRGIFEWPQAAIAGLLLLSLLPGNQGWWLGWGWPENASSGVGRAVWTLLIIGSIIAFFIWLSRRGKAPVGPAAPLAASSVGPADPTIPEPPSAAAFSATAPIPPPAGAPAEEFAAWREQQVLWKVQHDEFKRQQAVARAEAQRAAQEQSRAERAQAREQNRVNLARTRSHPLYTFTVVGLALIAGGLVTLLIESGELSVPAFAAGVATALAVLGIGIIINGLRGKRSGGASGFAWIGLVALAALAVSPQGSARTLTPTDNPNRSTQSYYVSLGDVELDLTSYFDNTDADSGAETVSLYVGVGDATVVLPSDADVLVSARVGSGSVDFGGTNPVIHTDGWSASSERYEGEAPQAGADRELTVRLWIGSGDVVIERERPNEGAGE